jgi:hypothetical protein
MIGFQVEKLGDNVLYQPGKTYKNRSKNQYDLPYYEFALDCALKHHPDDTVTYYLLQILGDVEHDTYYSMTNKMKVVKELTLDELLEYCTDGHHKYPSGSEVFFKNKKFHRDAGDLPAVCRQGYSDYIQEWWNDGIKIKHSICSSDREEYYTNNQLHSENDSYALHTIERGEFYRGTYGDDDDPSGYEPDTHNYYWYEHGLKHRGNDLPAVVEDNGKTLEWWKNGERHRGLDLQLTVFPDNVSDLIARFLDKPAIEITYTNGFYKAWYHMGKKHRYDYPAVIHCEYGFITKEWWHNDVMLKSERKPYNPTVDMI